MLRFRGIHVVSLEEEKEGYGAWGGFAEKEGFNLK